MARRGTPTDLTDAQWAVLNPTVLQTRPAGVLAVRICGLLWTRSSPFCGQAASGV